jgi:hypothetical protein
VLAVVKLLLFVVVTHGAGCLSFKLLLSYMMIHLMRNSCRFHREFTVRFRLLTIVVVVAAAPAPSATGGSSSGGATTTPPPQPAAASSPTTATALVAAVAAPLLAYCYLF